MPCQDAFVCRILQESAHPAVLIAALADGAGSAECAEVGAQLATSLVTNITSEQLMEGTALGQLTNVLRYAVGETRLALKLQAGHANRLIDDYACTLLVAILSVDGGIVARIGDGAVVIDDGEQGWHPVHWPDHGEYANTTHFLTEPDALEAMQLATLRMVAGGSQPPLFALQCSGIATPRRGQSSRLVRWSTSLGLGSGVQISPLRPINQRLNFKTRGIIRTISTECLE